MIPRIQISANGPECSRLVYGTWRILAEPRPTAQELNRRLQVCLELGLTTIDTAEIYGGYEVEEALGRALKLSPGLRDKLEIVTKCGIYHPCARHPEWRTAHYNATADRILKSVENSLRLLGTDRVELLLIHRPDWLTSADETADGLNRLLRAGKIRSAGVSNYTVSQFALLNSRLTQPLATNQIEFHLLHMDPMYDGTLDQCQQQRVSPMAWSPLAGGRLFDPQNEAAVLLHKCAEVLSPRYGNATLEQFAYAWLMASSEPPVANRGYKQHRAHPPRRAGMRDHAGTSGLVCALGSSPGAADSVNTPTGGGHDALCDVGLVNGRGDSVAVGRHKTVDG